MATTGPHASPRMPEHTGRSVPADVVIKGPRGSRGRQSMCPIMQMAFNYTRASIRRDRRAFYVGVATVALVVSFAAFLQSAVQRSPVVFFRLAEDQTGDADLMLLAGNAATGGIDVSAAVSGGTAAVGDSGNSGTTGGSGSGDGGAFSAFTGGGTLPFVNATDVAFKLRNNELVKGVAPRWLMLGELRHPKVAARNTSAFILIIDSDLENEVGLGRAWDRRKLGKEEIYVSETVLLELGVRANMGDRIVLHIDVLGMAASLGLLTTNVDLEDPESVRAALSDSGLDVSSPIEIDTSAFFDTIVGLGGGGVTLPDGVGDLFGPVNLDTTALFDTVYPGLRDALTINQELIVLDGVSDPGGKWAPLLGNVIVMEMDYAAELIRETLLNAVAQLETLEQLSVGVPSLFGVDGLGGTGGGVGGLSDFVNDARFIVEGINSATLHENALQAIVQYTHRNEAYMLGSDGLRAHMIDFTNSVFEDLTPQYAVTPTLPLAQALAGTIFIRLFLDVIFYAVVFLLGLLGTLVIYALVLGDVEEKTYEYGMLRALGMKQKMLVRVLGSMSTAFSAPGVVVGFIIAAILQAATMITLAVLLNTAISDTPLGLDISGVLYGLFIGIFVPALANVVPIRRALGKTLRDALDVYHQSFTDITVRMLRLQDIGLSPAQTALSVMLVIIGFVTYYVLPLAFVFREFALFLNILNGILMGMLLGLSLVGQSLQASVERAFLRVIINFYPGDVRMHTVVKKNLSGHRARNRKTAYMISISVAFLLFAGVMFSLQAGSLKTTVELILGADILAFSPLRDTPLPQEDFMLYLDSLKNPPDGRAPTVVDYSFFTYPLHQTAPASRVRFSNLVGEPESRAQVYGVQKNFMKVAFKQFEMPTETVEVESPDLTSEQLDEANSDVISQLHAGFGQLKLPVEADGRPPPMPVVSGSRVLPQYICNMSDIPAVAAIPAADRWNARYGGADGQGGFSEKAFTAAFNAIAEARGKIPLYSFGFSCFGPCGPTGTCTELPSVNATAVEQRVRTAYTDYVDVIISEALREAHSVDTTTPLRMLVRATDKDTDRTKTSAYMAKARAMVAKLPGFFFSTRSPTANNAPVVVTMESFGRLLLQAEADAKDAANARETTSDEDEDEDGNGRNGEAEVDVDGDVSEEAILAQFPQAQGPSVVATASNSSFRWVLSDPSWTQNSAGNDIPQGGQWVSDGGPDQVNEGANATNALDNDRNTMLRFGTAAPSWFMIDLGACVSVGGIRIFGTNTVGDVREWDLFSAPTPNGPWKLMAGGEAGTAEEGLQQRWHQFTFASYSAQYWRFKALSNYGWTQGTVVGDLQFSIAAASDCDADRALVDDNAMFVPKQRCFIKMAEGTTTADRQRTINGLRNYLTSDLVRVEDTQALIQSTDTASMGLQVFFTIVAALCLALCFFASWLSFTANIRENSREFGVLRALGFSAAETMRVYVYESVVVVLSSFAIGTVVGVLVAVSLTLQFNLFTEMPFSLEFPRELFSFMLVVSLMVSVTSSLWPARHLATVPVANVLKGAK